MNNDIQSAASTTDDSIYSYYPATGQVGTTPFAKHTADQIDEMVEQAAAAFQHYRQCSGAAKADFLEAIALGIEQLGDALLETCNLETALPIGRLTGERGRTTGQLRLFAALLREGSWVQARIDTAMPDRTPLPRADLRQMQRPLGPVAVFGASNFPLAFSVAGGDTASALAAGCTVVFKAHEAHPATSAMVGEVIQKAAETTNMPKGVFALVFGDGPIAGMQLVQHPAITAVGFTGSFKAGKAIYDAAVRRPVPIPVYAEMGSLNPVFVLPGALQERGEKIARDFFASLTMGVGQFCTNPGMLVCNRNGSGPFLESLKKAVAQGQGGTMLTSRMCQTFNSQVQRLVTENHAEVLAGNPGAVSGNAASPVVFKTDAATFISTPELNEEMFGPASVVVSCSSKEELLEVAHAMEGHLTATVHATAAELEEYKDLLWLLEQKAGRVLINGFPTGVEVCHAMVHGGPYPATTDARTTSVGTMAIYRYTRPVCYQDYPDTLLPAELQEGNPLGIVRMVNGS